MNSYLLHSIRFSSIFTADFECNTMLLWLKTSQSQRNQRLAEVKNEPTPNPVAAKVGKKTKVVVLENKRKQQLGSNQAQFAQREKYTSSPSEFKLDVTFRNIRNIFI